MQTRTLAIALMLALAPIAIADSASADSYGQLNLPDLHFEVDGNDCNGEVDVTCNDCVLYVQVRGCIIGG